jgi:phosphoglycerate dehydrogenase-like enzyme
VKIAILDDYQNVALELADWASIPGAPEIRVFNDHLEEAEALVSRLLPYDALCVMRERTPLTADLLDRLPKLKLIASTGAVNASIDVAAAKSRGITILYTGYDSSPTIELTWCLILAIARNLVAENASLRHGGWQVALGVDLKNRTLGVLGLGHVGAPVSTVGKAFGMRVIAWSPNLTQEKASAHGVELVSKEDLFRHADFLSIHLVLGRRTRGLVGMAELSLMKPTAFLVNTSRGPLVDEAALVDVLERRAIAGAAIDVFDREPLPERHPFRRLPNVLTTPHIGYVSRSLYETFYRDSVANIREWVLKQPERQGL